MNEITNCLRQIVNNPSKLSMNVKEEVDQDIVFKEEQFSDSVTVPLSGKLQQPTITQRCLKKEHSDSDNECPCEECTGSAWIQGEGGHWIKVKVEKESAPGDQPTEVQPVVSSPGVSLNLPADFLGSFFGDKEEDDPVQARPYACGNCGKDFPNRGQLKAHEAIHPEDRPFTCSACERGFTQKSDLKKHQITHSGQKQFNCLICGYKFNFKANLKNHERIHDSERSKAHCIDCGAPFTRIGDLLKHRQDNCHRRREQTPSDSTLFTQVTPLESTGVILYPSSYQCSTCGKTFPAGWQLEKHELIHSDVRELFVCQTCGKAYTMAGSLKTHQRLRCGQKRYRCPICKRIFSCEADCRRHFLSEHSEQRELRCTECSEPFEWSNLQIQHRQHCSKLGDRLNK